MELCWSAIGVFWKYSSIRCRPPNHWWCQWCRNTQVLLLVYETIRSGNYLDCSTSSCTFDQPVVNRVPLNIEWHWRNDVRGRETLMECNVGLSTNRSDTSSDRNLSGENPSCSFLDWWSSFDRHGSSLYILSTVDDRPTSDNRWCLSRAVPIPIGESLEHEIHPNRDPVDWCNHPDTSRNNREPSQR